MWDIQEESWIISLKQLSQISANHLEMETVQRVVIRADGEFSKSVIANLKP